MDAFSSGPTSQGAAPVPPCHAAKGMAGRDDPAPPTMSASSASSSASSSSSSSASSIGQEPQCSLNLSCEPYGDGQLNARGECTACSLLSRSLEWAKEGVALRKVPADGHCFFHC